MPLLLNLDKIESGSLNLIGEISLLDLEMETLDELIKPEGPLVYNITVKQNDESLILKGSLKMLLKCECSRCLKIFELQINQNSWNCKISLKGEDSLEINHGTIEMTPYLLEDTFLAYPQHPLCKNDCEGIHQVSRNLANSPLAEISDEDLKKKNIWGELDKLNLD